MLLLATGTFVSCGSKTSNEPLQKKGSSGKTLELLVVADRDVFQGDVKALVDSIFKAPQEGLINPEPLFDVANIPVSSYKSSEMFRVHRNIILLDVNPQNPNKVYHHTDSYAAPQVIYDFAVKDIASLRQLLRKYSPAMIEEFYDAEHKRIVKAFKTTEGFEIEKAVEKQFGFRLTYSEEFEVAKADNPSPDFAWVRKEAKDFGLGTLIHTAPYESKNQFSTEEIVRNIDTLMKRHIQGPAEGSYMATEHRTDFTHKVMKMKENYCVETRGNWRLYGDFMGGPFVAYTILAPDQKNVITLVGYVYCPRFDKRDYLMQVEGICHSIQFPQN